MTITLLDVSSLPPPPHPPSNKRKWVVPENIHTLTTGGIEILPPMRSEIPKCSTPHVFGNSKMLYPPCVRKFQNALPPMHSEIPKCSTPHAFGNSKMLHPPTHSELQTPLPRSLSEFQRCFRPLQNFLFNLLTPPETFFSAS